MGAVEELSQGLNRYQQKQPAVAMGAVEELSQAQQLVTLPTHGGMHRISVNLTMRRTFTGVAACALCCVDVGELDTA